MSSNISDNYMYNRLYLKNIPIEITKNQLKNIYFKDLDNLDIHFPKNQKSIIPDRKVAFIQFSTANEGILARQVINLMEWNNVQANFANKANIENKIVSTVANSELTNEHEFMELKICSFCGSDNAEFMCNDCETLYHITFYCSIEHQHKDWPKHKIECKKLPNLKRIPERQNVIRSNDEEEISDFGEQEVKKDKRKYIIPNIEFSWTEGSKFHITYVATNRILYVKPIVLNNPSKLDELLQCMKKDALVALSNPPEVYDYVLAPYMNSYYRAQIQDIFDTENNGINFKVKFIDFGNEDCFSLTSLRRLNYKLRGFPIQVFKVFLDGVEVAENDQIISYLNDIRFKKEVLELIAMRNNMNGALRQVIFKHLNSGLIINDYVNELIQKVYFDNKLIPEIPNKNHVKLGIADCSQLEQKNFLACMPFEYFSQYKNMIAEIQEYCQSSKNSIRYTPVDNEIYLLKCENIWYRAINSKENKALLIDKMLNISLEEQLEIRKIPQMFARKLFTSICYVENLSLENMRKLLNENYAYFNVTFDPHTNCIILNCA